MSTPELLSQWNRVARQASKVDDAIRGGTALDTLLAAKRLHDETAEFIFAQVEQAAREGVTQKTIAHAIGVPASTLTGLRQSVGAA